VAAFVWLACAWLLARTSVPRLHLAGLDQNRYFAASLLDRTRRYTRGEDLLWLLATAASLIALAVLARVLPRSVRGIGLGRIGSSLIVAMVLLVTLWFVSLPFSLADLWWQHHYGLGPFDVGGWLSSQWATLGNEAVSVVVAVMLLVGFAGRFRRTWWIFSGIAIVAIAAGFAFAAGYLAPVGGHPLRDPVLRADVRRLERVEHVTGTPVRVQKVSTWTDQANAFTVGLGRSTHVVLWDTLLDGRFTRGEEDVVIAHELGHVRSRHIAKAIGWTALVVFPTLFIVALATRRRGGLANPANLPLAFLVLAVLAVLTSPVQNAVSRRYEAEADWRALNATHDPAAAQRLFQSFAKTNLEQPDPPAWDYILLENHPTLMQRIAMTRAWSARRR
jgi:Zn-dependent protease with chaperone function